MFKKITNFAKEHPYISATITGIIGLLFGFVGEDLYKLKIKPHLFPTRTKIVFESVSTSTLKPRYIINGQNHYYEITSFRIENVGDYKVQKGQQLKIQLRGEILGITPIGLESRFKIHSKDNKIAIFDLHPLEPRNTIRGEIHSLSNMLTDREEVQIGIDPIGDFDLIGPKLF